MRVIAEYWPASDKLSVLSIAEADNFAPLMEILLEWQDVLQIEFTPAITADEGLKVGPEVMSHVMASA